MIQLLLLRNVLNLIESPDYTWAFEPRRSVPEMAQKHTDQSLVISLDIKDYFPSIRVQHLEALLIHHGCGPVPARTIAELLTYKFFVPQGALTSPKVSNLITGETFGPPIMAYAAQHGMEATVYADDITLSLPRENVPSTLMEDGSRELPDLLFEHGRRISRDVQTMVEAYPFRVNPRKTKVMPYCIRQWVCGVVVNEKTNLRYESRKELRAVVHNSEKHGIETQAERMGVSAETFVNKVRGRLNWFTRLNPALGQPLLDQFSSTVQAFTGSEADGEST